MILSSYTSYTFIVAKYNYTYTIYWLIENSIVVDYMIYGMKQNRVANPAPNTYTAL